MALVNCVCACFMWIDCFKCGFDWLNVGGIGEMLINLVKCGLRW